MLTFPVAASQDGFAFNDSFYFIFFAKLAISVASLYEKLDS